MIREQPFLLWLRSWIFSRLRRSSTISLHRVKYIKIIKGEAWRDEWHFEERVPLTRISSGLISPSRWNIGGKSNLLKLKQDWGKTHYMNQSRLTRKWNKNGKNKDVWIAYIMWSILGWTKRNSKGNLNLYGSLFAWKKKHEHEILQLSFYQRETEICIKSTVISTITCIPTLMKCLIQNQSFPLIGTHLQTNENEHMKRENK